MKNTQEIPNSYYNGLPFNLAETIKQHANREALADCKLETLDGYKLDFTEAPPLPKFEKVKTPKGIVGLWNFVRDSVYEFKP